MAFPHDELCPQVQVRLGDQWIDLWPHILGRVVINYGGKDEASTVLAGSCTFIVDNDSGDFSPDFPQSPYWPHIDIAAPLRVQLPPGMVDPGLEGRFFGEVSLWRPYWQQGVEDNAQVLVQAHGVLLRISGDSQPLESALRRSTMAHPHLIAYWPLEDGVDADFGVSPLPGVAPTRWRGRSIETQPGVEPCCPGSGTSVRLVAGVEVSGAVLCTPPSSSAAGWIVESVFRIPTEAEDGIIWAMEVYDTRDNVWIARAELTGSNLAIRLEYIPDQEDLGSAVLLSDQALSRGTFHQVRIAAQRLGNNRRWTFTIDGQVRDGTIAVGGANPSSVGNVSRVQLLANAMIVGHIAVYDDNPLPFGSNDLETYTWRAAEGWVGEPATSRTLRMCAEENIPARLDLAPALVDTFDRTVVDGWGAADTHQPWVTVGDPSKLSVSGGVGRIDSSQFFVDLGFVLTPDDYDDIDLHGLFTTDDDTVAAFAIRWRQSTVSDDPDYYLLGVSSQSIFVEKSFGGVVPTIADDAFDPGPQPWHIRVRAVGPLLQIKAWSDMADEPDEWSLTVSDLDLTRGQVGPVHAGDPGAEATVSDLTLTDLGVGQPMGVQRIGTLLDGLRQAAVTDGGTLYEDITRLGLVYRPLAAIYNQLPKMELSCRGASDGEPGQIGADYAPAKDNRAVRNDRSVTQAEGASARAVKDRGPRSVKPPPDGIGRQSDNTW